MGVTTLELRLVEDIEAGKEVDLERAALIASGITDEVGIDSYTRKLDKIQAEYRDALDLDHLLVPHTDLDLIVKMYTFLTSNRIHFNEDSSLHQAIDAYTSEKDEDRTWNCIGASSLFTLLTLREGISLNLVTDIGSFDSHVYCRFKEQNNAYDIELTRLIEVVKSDGTKPQELPTESLIYLNFLNRADIIREHAEEIDSEDQLKEAIEVYTLAIKSNPEIASSAYVNRGVAKIHLAHINDGPISLDLEAEQDFKKALDINLQDTTALMNLAYLSDARDESDQAQEYCQRAIAIDPNYEPAIEFLKEL